MIKTTMALGVKLLSTSVVLALAGCSLTRPDTALKVIESQREQQAMVQQYEMERSRDRLPSEQSLELQRIREAQRDGRYFASLAYIDAYLLKQRATPDVLLLKADALRVTGNAAESEALYRQVLRTSSRRAQAHHGLGLLAGSQERFDEAVYELTQAARLMPDNAEVLSDLGYAMLRAGNLDGARLPLGQAAELQPDNPKIVSNLVLLLLVSNERSRAEQLSQRAGLSAEAFQSILALAMRVRAQTPSPAASRGHAGVGHEPLIR